MLGQFLFIGVGGSGGKTVRAIKEELRRTLSLTKEGREYLAKKRGLPEVWQFLAVDTPYIQDGEQFPARMLPDSEYLGLARSGTKFDDLLEMIKSRGQDEKELVEELMNSLPRQGQYGKPVANGAGQYRAIGRAVALSQLDSIKFKIEQALNSMMAAHGKEMAELKELFKASVSTQFNPNIVIISSLSGGSGSGQWLDVSEAIKATYPLENWVNEQTAVLFAPDVFDDVKSARHGIAANSLAALGELVNGKLRHQRTPSLQHAYTQAKIGAPVKGPAYNVGAKHVYMFGKHNGSVVYNSQNEVYLGVASSLAKWVTDSEINETIVNIWHQNPEQDGPPLNSFGFARVSLGMGYFADYSAARLARSVVNNLAYGHEDHRLEDGESAEAIKARKVEELFERQFLRDFGFGVASFTAELRPEQIRQKWRERFSDTLVSDVDRSERGLSVERWVGDITQKFQAVFPRMRKEWVDERKIDDAVRNLQNRAVQVTLRYASQYGLLITVGLLEKLALVLKSSAVANGKLDESLERLYGQAQSDFNQTLGAANAGKGSIAWGNDNLNSATNQMLEKGLVYLVKEDNALIYELIADAADNFITPLANELSFRLETLRKNTKDSNYNNTGVNMFENWPDGNLEPKMPAQNIGLLISPKNYESNFQRTLCNSVTENTFTAAMSKAVEEVVCGSIGIKELETQHASASLYSSERLWSPFTYNENGLEEVTLWSPRAILGKAPQKWAGTFESDLQDWQDYASRYIRIEGRQFSEEISQTLNSWLLDKNPNVATQREQELVAEFTNSLKHSDPFSNINEGLHSKLYGTSPSVTAIISGIPLQQGTNVGAGITAALTRHYPNLSQQDISRFFNGPTDSSTIDIFTTYVSRVEHFVLSNLMKPVTELWGSVKGVKESKDGFLQWRESRPIAETIPWSPTKIDSAIRGWYFAKLLNLIVEKKEPGAKYIPRLALYETEFGDDAFVDFPYPLNYLGAVVPAEDQIAAVLGSVGIAYAECQQDMSPLRPFEILVELGGGPRNKLSSELVNVHLDNWIKQEVSFLDQANAPKPNAEVAGDRSMTVDERKQLAINFFEAELRSYRHNVMDIPLGKPHTYHSWQLRREIVKALTDLIDMTTKSS
jgi:hypothetical protein